MNEQELRIRVYETLNEYINSLMSNNNVPAAMMEDAINKILVNLKDKVMTEFIIAASQPPMDNAPEEVIQEEEEVNGDNN